MTDELLHKLKDTLAAGITQEKDLVYLLVEIRKLMDREKYRDPIITSFSNWVVHIELSYSQPGTTEILKDFDTIVTLFKEDTSSKRMPWHYNFEGLRHRLRIFLKHFSQTLILPRELTDNDEQWSTFMWLYASIVGDCPISFKASKEKLKYLKELELQRHPSGYDLLWKVTLKDGETSYFSMVGATFSLH